ncbi:microcin C ABC transporter permease YejB [Candidatus Hepatobacter penaei]|uniref:microcin C ABC transporter permease YejB n=1 Tax=Candidatus Hepatobacter penaei TaxID=1274402 RepID=UPI0004F2F7F0|nr:microcin C ABC transporter permease YejB [Candidatus Hepatobacter penaei]TGW14554.1 microcin C ABC transporter permease YejB [bacterium NHP-B]
MRGYFLKRVLLAVPTLLGILFLNFLLIQWAPGGPVEQMVAQLQGLSGDGTSGLSGAEQSDMTSFAEDHHLYRGGSGLDPQIIRDIEKMYGFDKPFWTRFLLMIKKYLTGDLGVSYFKGRSVASLIMEKLPVSISLGLWSTLLVYSLSIVLGVAKARAHKTTFDVVTSFVVIIGYAVPGFLFGVLLVLLFAGGSFWSWFPLRGLTSPDFETLSLWGKVCDYFWHMALPLLTQVLSGFASLTFLTKNAFLEEMNKPYVLTAYAKGLSARQVLFGHVFRNACLVLLVGFPQAFLHLFFTGAFLVEIIFSLDGLGLLGFTAAITRDYPVIFGTLYVFTLLSLLLHIVGDFLYMKVDPRVHFEKRRR